jgi:hypothetical protein
MRALPEGWGLLEGLQITRFGRATFSLALTRQRDNGAIEIWFIHFRMPRHELRRSVAAISEGGLKAVIQLGYTGRVFEQAFADDSEIRSLAEALNSSGVYPPPS